MATKSFAYDHPQYTVSQMVAGTIAAGSGTTVKFAAFTNMIIKSVVMRPVVAGTSNDITTALQILASGGTTNTFTVGTVGSAAVANLVATAGSTNTNATYSGTGIAFLAQGDEFAIKKGTDATITYDYAVEYVVAPGANVTSM